MCIFVTLRNIVTDFYPNIISFTNTKDIYLLVRTPMHFSTTSTKRQKKKEKKKKKKATWNTN